MAKLTVVTGAGLRVRSNGRPVGMSRVEFVHLRQAGLKFTGQHEKGEERGRSYQRSRRRADR